MILEHLFNRMTKNLALRRKQLEKRGFEAFRWYDLDMPEYPLVIDVYGTAAVIWNREFSDHPVFTPEHWAAIKAFCARSRDIPEAAIFIKKREVTDREGQYQKQETRQELRIVQEGERRFEVNVSDYLDCGLFLDHRPLRQALAHVTKRPGDLWVNLFSYTCSLSVPGAMRGIPTYQVDLSRTYLDWGQRNFALNGLNVQPSQFIQTDVLQWIPSGDSNALLRQASLVICDPPIFSRSKKMQQTFDIQRDQEFLLGTLLKKMSPEAILLFSTPRQRFKLAPSLQEQYAHEDCTSWSIPFDYHNKRIHHLYLLGQQRTERWTDILQKLRPTL